MRKRAKKGKCVVCGHPVSGGGNHHAKGYCPPPRGVKTGTERHLKMKKRRRQRRKSPLTPQRGLTVTGTGKKQP